jgi:hypothetical protein
MGAVSRRTRTNFRDACLDMGWSILCLGPVPECGPILGAYCV